MATQLDILGQLGDGSRVAIIRLRSLGDCILTTPALHLLQQARPDLQLKVVVEDRFAAVFGARALPPRLSALRAFRPDVCLNLHGGARSARLTLFSGARFRAGFDMFRPSRIYNVKIPTAQEILGVSRPVHTAEHLASAVFYLGTPISEVPRASVCAPPGRSPLVPERDYAIIHPVAATDLKTWPSDKFLQVARHLKSSRGFEPVFVGGPGDDLSAFEEYRTLSGAPLTELARVMSDASFFVGNDSGPAHLAAAFGVPQVVLFGPSDSVTWAPWRTLSEVVQSHGNIKDLPVGDVIDGVDRVAGIAHPDARRVQA